MLNYVRVYLENIRIVNILSVNISRLFQYINYKQSTGNLTNFSENIWSSFITHKSTKIDKTILHLHVQRTYFFNELMNLNQGRAST